MKSPHDGPFRLTPDEVVEFAKLLAISTHAFAGCTLTPDEAVEFAKLPTLDEWLEQRVEVIRPLPTLDDRLGQRVEAGVVLLPSLSLDELLIVLGCFVRHILAPNNHELADWSILDRMKCIRYFLLHRKGSDWLDDLSKRLTDIPEGTKPDWLDQPVRKDAFHEIAATLRTLRLGNWPPKKAVLERLEDLRKTVQETVPGPGRVGAPGDVTTPVPLPSPPWRKGITLPIKECLLAYLAGDKKYVIKGAYEKRPDKLAGLVCDEIAIAAKSKKNRFDPPEGRWPRGRTAGGNMSITFDGVKKPTKKGTKTPRGIIPPIPLLPLTVTKNQQKNGRKPRES